MTEEELPLGERESDAPRFEDFDLAPSIQKAVARVGYETPSPIQRRSIPPLLEGCDLLGVAQTGTGKTAAFALPLLSRLDPNLKVVQMLCLAPTRELAIQVAEAMETFAEDIPGLSAQAKAELNTTRVRRGLHCNAAASAPLGDHATVPNHPAPPTTAVFSPNLSPISNASAARPLSSSMAVPQ